ncbi:hypothetical protein AWV80_11150 [Cupriavidus sp. UYMU48A]|nr:hypothetical protein AWV80_11150 [Cupriavidus sp. UYMU48A]
MACYPRLRSEPNTAASPPPRHALWIGAWMHAANPRQHNISQVTLATLELLLSILRPESPQWKPGAV